MRGVVVARQHTSPKIALALNNNTGVDKGRRYRCDTSKFRLRIVPSPARVISKNGISFKYRGALAFPVVPEHQIYVEGSIPSRRKYKFEVNSFNGYHNRAIDGEKKCLRACLRRLSLSPTCKIKWNFSLQNARLQTIKRRDGFSPFDRNSVVNNNNSLRVLKLILE